jgi:hypothetical protein
MGRQHTRQVAPLSIEIVGSLAAEDWETPLSVRVTCEHAATSQPWRRTCPHGCHRGGYWRASRCIRVCPPREVLEALGVLGHGARVGCGCDRRYWMTQGQLHLRLPGIDEAGPEHGLSTLEAAEQVEIQAHEGPVTAEDEQQLRASMLLQETVERMRAGWQAWRDAYGQGPG